MNRLDFTFTTTVAPQLLINSLPRTYVLSIIQCALVDDYVAYYLPFGCRRYDLLRSFTMLKELRRPYHRQVFLHL